ncbi:hypothetical protein NP493_810g00006 [Ridgeia piscesae]|uniref:Nuclear pore complex protein Nup160 n=1 Tax=Ridgeia piscesae TaxID=27915 RepID=A0AAD9KNE2_RIDPI|nr:hypothetical protein NP493_810g00006 [Ridgeia piscesae]
MAAEMCVRFREVLQDQDYPLRWKEITVANGGVYSQSPEGNIPESGGGYSYKESGHVTSPTRNRFIYWRTKQNVVELVEVSLDYNLGSNCVRFSFPDAPIAGGLSIHESHGYVIILVPTLGAAHRLIFPHPNRLQKYENIYSKGSDLCVASIFSHATVISTQDPANCHHLTPGGGGAYHITAATTWLASDGEAHYAMVTGSGSILLVKLPPTGVHGGSTQSELQQTSIMQRLWSGLLPSAMKGNQISPDASVSLCFHQIGKEKFIYAVCRDHKIRLWSCKSNECVMVTDLLEAMPVYLGTATETMTGNGHMVKTFYQQSTQDTMLCVYLCLEDSCQFCVYNPVIIDGAHTLELMATVFGFEEQIVDFCVTSTHIWTLHLDGEMETVVRCAPIFSEGPAILNWLTVLMEPVERSDLEIPTHVDPREAYVAQIFTPGRFSTLAILKACNIYRRCLDTAQLPDAACIPVAALKAEVLAIVEHEIQTAASEYEMVEEEYYQLQLDQWTRFYSCCVQYQEQGTRALGIFADGITGMVSIVKSNMASFIRICDPIEHIHMTAEPHSIREMLISMPQFNAEPQLCHDMQLLCNAIKLVGQCLTDEVTYYFEQDLYHTQCPREVAKSIAMNLIAEQHPRPNVDRDTGPLTEIERHIQSIEDTFQVVSTLIELLDLGQGQPEGMLDDASVDAARQLLVGHLFGSTSGIRLLCNSTRQMAVARLEVARNLLVLLTLMAQLTGQASVQMAGVSIITSELISRVSTIVQSYYIIKWCSDTVATPPQANVVDSNVRQLEALDLTDTLPAGTLQKELLENLSVLELFLRAEGGEKVQYLLSQGDLLEEDPCAVWKNVLMPVVTSICQLIWPSGSSFVLPEFLLYNCQYVHLQDYVRLTRQWCEWNASSSNFVLGQSYLNCGEPYKSIECFRAATHGIKSEEFLMKLLQMAVEDPKHTEVIYYLKVIRLYEQFRLPDLIVTLAKTAISIAEDDDPNVPTLWSKVFKHQLELGHSEEAYNAMIANPDPSRRKDCLRQFLVVLCERADLQTLVQLPYKDRHVDLEEEVVNVLASRARSIDLSKHNYYDLLYAFHVFRGNFRRAGTVMYEYGLRVGQELSNLKGLQQQAKCYLAMLNALRLVNPKYAWIVKPIPSTKQVEETAASPKRDADGNTCCPTLHRQVELLELEDIEREYMLVHARLQLLQKDADPAHMTGPTPPADETVGLLVNAGLFDSAINICKLYKMPFTTIFEGLASRCVSLAASSQDYMPAESAYTAAAWHWLQQNELTSANATRDTSAADQAWRLLQSYLNKYEDPTTRYHRCVAVKLLSHNFHLPDWFIASYKKINAPELLSLYLNYDLLEEAALLVIEYIDAILGNGNEYFGLQTSLRCGAPAVWLPYLYIDQLLTALSVQSDKFYAQVCILVTQSHLV